MSQPIDLNTNSVISVVESFLPNSTGKPSIFAKCEIDSELDLRRWFAHEMRAGNIRAIAPKIYAHQIPSAFSDSIVMPSAVALALCRQNSWRIALPMSMARFLFGLEVKPCWFDTFTYDGTTSRSYPSAGLLLQPTCDHSIFDLTPSGQAIRLAMRDVLDQMTLRQMVKFSAAAWFSHPEFKLFLEEDLAAGRLSKRESSLAIAILETPRSGVGREAPFDFKPADHTDAAKIVDWQIIRDRSGGEHLAAAHIHGHSHIADGESLACSTALVWIDETAGWARTRSRVYRLVGPKLRY